MSVAGCTCGEAVRFPDERSEELCEAKSQEGARELRSSPARRTSCARRRGAMRLLRRSRRGAVEGGIPKFAYCRIWVK